MNAERRTLGLVCAAFGVLSLAPILFVWLSAHGPAPMAVPAAFWSRLFYGMFIGLVVTGYSCILVSTAKRNVFHGGPTLDFTIGLGILAIASSFGRPWIPGVFLIAFGLRLANGRALLNPS